MGKFRASSYTKRERYEGKHRFEHWYRDNSVYFVTARVRGGFHAFNKDAAKAIFWDRFGHHTNAHGFEPWVTSLMSNHYHTLGYLKDGGQLGEMMRKVHGSVAWVVRKDLGVKWVPFWKEKGNKDYFDGCIRDVLQAVRAYRYVLMQAVRAGVVRDWRDYPNTRVGVGMDEGIAKAVRVGAFLEEVPYARYEKKRRRGQRS